MININGKEWHSLTAHDVEELVSTLEIEESFYFEFKDDRVKPAKLIEEISAFANTFGGYVFLGILDAKEIEGCSAWNEQRIHTTIHDSLTPTPSFDIKKFISNDNVIYVIRVDAGPEPPYITSKGKIYERLSSGSFPINDATRISQIYYKREQELAKIERTITIPPVTGNINNIYGYIDVGFSTVFADTQSAINTFWDADLISIAESQNIGSESSLFRVGNSIVFTPGGISSNSQWGLPAHLNNFLEIMNNGNAKMRLLLSNNDAANTSVNMFLPFCVLKRFQDLYAQVMGKEYPLNFRFAKAYESLTVLKQFCPVFFYTDEFLDNKRIQEQNQLIVAKIKENRSIRGIDTVITDDRIPKTGLYTIDRKLLQQNGEEYTAESIIKMLFYSSFANLGLPHIPHD